MSPSSSNWLVLVGGLGVMLAAWMYARGLARAGMMLAGIALSLGAVLRISRAPLALYEATTWLIWLGVALAIGAVIKRTLFADPQPGSG